jgi:hypothetical protein
LNGSALGDGTLTYGTYKAQWYREWRYSIYDYFDGHEPAYYEKGAPVDVWGPKDSYYMYVLGSSEFNIRHIDRTSGDEEPYDQISFDLDYGYYLGSYRFINNGDSFTITDKEGTQYLKFRNNRFVEKGDQASKAFR